MNCSVIFSYPMCLSFFFFSFRMIQGTCKVLGCPFYHKLAKEKMPTCYYFLKGQCNRDNCIYPHVKVNKNANTCEDFLNGYCSRGEKVCYFVS